MNSNVPYAQVFKHRLYGLIHTMENFFSLEYRSVDLYLVLQNEKTARMLRLRYLVHLEMYFYCSYLALIVDVNTMNKWQLSKYYYYLLVNLPDIISTPTNLPYMRLHFVNKPSVYDLGLAQNKLKTELILSSHIVFYWQVARLTL